MRDMVYTAATYLLLSGFMFGWSVFMENMIAKSDYV